MRIKRVDISGFKSFCDPVRVVFDHAVTSVVGPNGCGKSNIVDAIRWALGEQSSKNLRGKSMEDVIFNGSEKRGPKSFAEVTITFDNTDGLSHPSYVEYPEVGVTRRLHRDGSSEYLLNKTPCRLMDITDLFLGTGGGARAYSIIEQGRIGLIVSARAEDRRLMIEEAAGITKYKSARKSAERRMDQTRQNLLRVRDVVGEMERTLASLKRQAKKAERFIIYRKEQTDLELYLSSHRYLELRAKAMSLTLKRVEEQTQLQRRQDAFAALETNVESLRLAQGEANSKLDKETELGYKLDKEIQVLESEIRHLQSDLQRLKAEQTGAVDALSAARKQQSEIQDERALLDEQIARIEKGRLTADERLAELTERADITKRRLQDMARAYDERRDRISRLRAKLAASENNVQNLEQRIVEAEMRLETSRQERKELRNTAAELKDRVTFLEEQTRVVEKRLEQARRTEQLESEAKQRLEEELESCGEELRRAKGDLQAKKSIKGSLEEVMDNLGSHDSCVKESVELLRERNPEALEGLLVDAVECPAQHEQALAAVLATELQSLVLRDRGAGIELLSQLAQRESGRVAVLPKGHLTSRTEARVEITDPGIRCRLIDELSIQPDLRGAFENLIGDTFVVADLETAERVYQSCKGRADFVTPDGQVLEAGGMMRGGQSASAGASLLGQKRQIRELEKEITGLEGRVAHLEERHAIAKEDWTVRSETLERARREAQDQQIVLAEVRKDQTRAAEDLATLDKRFEALDQGVQRQEEMVLRARDDRDHAAQEAAEFRVEISALERSIAEQGAEIEVVRVEAERLTSAVSDVRVQKASLEQQHQSSNNRKAQLEQHAVDLARRLAHTEQRREQSYAELGHTAGTLFRHKEVLETRVEAARRAHSQIEGRRRELDEAQLLLAESEEELKRRRRELDDLSRAVTKLEMDERESSMEVAHLLEKVFERNDVDLLRVLGDYHLRPLPGPDIKLRIDELRNLIDRMGPINLAAIEEFEQESTRYEDLTAQKTDLEQALEDLERAIARMDKDSRIRFKEAFEAINTRFKELFPRMFNGGRAELLLTDQGDMLRTGVDILAHPPGKKPGNIELLSGGEKALTAVSLLFAIFLHRPSPFCILDEVDAPLDDANIGRFIEMVKKMTDRSQFIIITHSKLTMERSDALYGVTMQEPGISKLVSVRLNQAMGEQLVGTA